MKNDFKPLVDHAFTLRADWGAVNCKVLAAEPNKTLSYRWAAYGLESIVTWTLSRRAQGPLCAWSSWGSAASPCHEAKGGWRKFLAALEQVLA